MGTYEGTVLSLDVLSRRIFIQAIATHLNIKPADITKSMIPERMNVFIQQSKSDRLISERNVLGFDEMVGKNNTVFEWGMRRLSNALSDLGYGVISAQQLKDYLFSTLHLSDVYFREKHERYKATTSTTVTFTWDGATYITGGFIVPMLKSLWGIPTKIKTHKLRSGAKHLSKSEKGMVMTLAHEHPACLVILNEDGMVVKRLPRYDIPMQYMEHVIPHRVQYFSDRVFNKFG